MSDLTYPLYPVLGFSASALVLVPLSWHFQAWNAGTCLYMLWTSIACLNLALNSVLWHGNALDFAPVWCDISSRIIVATAVAIPAASLCIMRRLYKIAAVRLVNISYSEKRKAVIVDLSIGLGIPIVQIIMQYIVSGHRYDIFGDVGCFPFTYNTPVAYPLSVVWPVVIGFITAIYCALILRAFFKRRTQFNEFIKNNTSLTANRYFRLMSLATVELVCTLPISAYGLWINAAESQIQPWISWSDTHWNYSHVGQYPALLWRMDRHGAIGMEFTRWGPILCAVVFFGFFGFAEEARRNYRKAYVAASSVFGTSDRSYPSSSGSVLPTTHTPRGFKASFPRSPISKSSWVTSSSDVVTSPTASYDSHLDEKRFVTGPPEAMHTTTSFWSRLARIFRRS